MRKFELDEDARYRLMYRTDGVLTVLVLAIDKREDLVAYRSTIERLLTVPGLVFVESNKCLLL
ncbi:hypothetical protein [Orrella sp. 11846]|uniref:hypothetical protein n=1 Tax=Orrella sp. 11846 TaxID=3409913 RepID=UPI003B5BFD31